MEQKLKDFLSKSLIYLVTGNKLDRMAWKKAFVALGVKPDQMVFFESLPKAEQAVEERPCGVLVSAYEVQDKKADRLLELFRKSKPNLADSFCMVVTEEETLKLKLCVLEYELDGVLLKPFNAKELDNKMRSLMGKKAGLSAAEKKVGKAWELLGLGEMDKVELFLDKASEAMQDLIGFKALKGKFLRLKGKGKEAVELYEEGSLSGDYAMLSGLFDTLAEENLHEQAYEAASDLIGAFPLHPKRLSNYAKICILTGNYHSFVQYALKMEKEGVKDRELSHQLAAGLAVCAKSIGIADRKKCVEASLSAVRLGKERRQIVEQGLKNLLDLGEHKLVEELSLELAEEEELEETLAVAEYRVLEAQGGDTFLVFQKGMELTNKGVHDFHVYELLLKSAKEAGRKPEFIEEMVDNAIKHCPEKSDYFKSLVA